MNAPLTHPSMRHPLTGQPLQAVGTRRNGRPIWPILGGDDSVPPAAPPPPTPTPPPAPAPPKDDKGFPEGTPLEQMKPEQREAYWKHQSRRHEERVRQFGNLTPEQLTALQEKATRADALERDLMSESQKAVAEAADKAKSDARDAYIPRLVSAEFRAAAAGRVEPDRLASILEPLDMTKFLNGDDVDTEKVLAFIDGIAPATTRPKGPSALGLGRHTVPSGAPGDQGRAQAAKRFGAKNPA